jgi:hypothetical protein
MSFSTELLYERISDVALVQKQREEKRASE